ncbi:MAG: hypothetical protein R3E58_05470 [Phycisphaerae bacterium]
MPLLKQNAKLLASQAAMGWLFAFTLIVMFSCVWSYDPARSGTLRLCGAIAIALGLRQADQRRPYIKRLFFGPLSVV